MTPEEHVHFAKKAMRNLVERVLNYENGPKWITYGDLAAEIGYPLPHIYNDFGKRIGITLGAMGHLFDPIIIDGERVPMLQALAVGSKTKLPSDGLQEFEKAYASLSTNKKRDFVQCEYAKIFNFGSKWNQVLEALGVENTETGEETLRQRRRYNPYGSEGSPEHVALRDWVIANPAFFNLPEGTVGIPEYPLKSGDKVDVVFTKDKEALLGVEVKSWRSDKDDLRRGIFQCIKYKAVLTAEATAADKIAVIDCLLLAEGSLGTILSHLKTKLGVKVIPKCRVTLGTLKMKA
jgi:hypothetical protein